MDDPRYMGGGSELASPAGRWRAVGVSLQGTSHLARQLPCQDAHVCRLLPGGGLVAVVADGAGSAPFSAEGARAAAVDAAGLLAARLSDGPPDGEPGWRAAMLEAFEAARRAVELTAAAGARSPHDFATTLTCVAAAGGWLATGQLGDGLVVAESEGELFLAARPQRGEYANEAYFLTMSEPLPYVEIGAWHRPVQALAASTDGLLRLALRLPGMQPHAPFFRPLFDFVASRKEEAATRVELVRFLDSPRLCARTDDDKTLVLAVQRPVAVGGLAARGAEPLALQPPVFATNGASPGGRDGRL